MKIMIPYDGSKCGDAAIADLRRAGLPPDADATVLTVRELWAPTLPGYGLVEGDLLENDQEAKDELQHMLHLAQSTITTAFPGWRVATKALVGSPARSILEEATEGSADLIVLGSHGHTALGRIFLGSVSHKVAVEAPCSVRVVREHDEPLEGPVKIAIALKGAPSSDDAVRAVAARHWPRGSEVRLITAVGPGKLIGPKFEALIADLKANHMSALDVLTAKGLDVSSLVVEGDPRSLVPEAAERWGAECIFVGTRDLTLAGRFALGSVSSAVLTRASCTVEVVRMP